MGLISLPPILLLLPLHTWSCSEVSLCPPLHFFLLLLQSFPPCRSTVHYCLPAFSSYPPHHTALLLLLEALVSTHREL